MLAKPVQPAKQPLPKEVTEEGIVILVKPEQLPKQPSLKEVTEEGIVMLVKLEQYEKQPSLKEVTEEGIVILVKPEHPWYLQPIITQYFIDNKSEIWLLFLIAHSKRWRFNAFIDY